MEKPASSVECGFLATFVAANQIVTLVLRASAVFVSRSLLGHGFGALPAPGGSSLFCFDCIALRVTVSARNLFAKFSERFLRSLRKCRASALGAGPLAGFAGGDPRRTREFNKTETKS